MTGPNLRLDFYEGAKKHAPWCGACFYIAIESRQGLGITIHLKYFQSNRLPPPISLKIPKLFPRLLLRVFQSGFQKSRGAIGVFYLLFGRFERKILSIAPSKGMIWLSRDNLALWICRSRLCCCMSWPRRLPPKGIV